MSSPTRTDLPLDQLLSWITDVQSDNNRLSSAGTEASNVEPRPSRLNLAVFDGSGGYGGDVGAQARRRHPTVEMLLTALGVPHEALVRRPAVEFNSYPPTSKTSNIVDIVSSTKNSRVYSVARDVFGVAWRWNEELRTTTGVIWCIYPEGLEQIDFVLEALQKEQALLEHPMVLGHLALRTTVLSLQVWVRKGCEKIIEAKTQIGYRMHVEKVPGRDGGQQVDPAKLSGEVSGYALNLTSSVLCLQGIVNFAQFVIEENEAFLEKRKASKDSKKAALLYDYVNRHTKAWQRKATAELLHCEAWKQKAGTVVQGLLSLIAKRDQEASIGIAQDSRILAQETKRDATSMKAIAAVTMAFLPGTFVSVSARANSLTICEAHPSHCGPVTIRHAHV